MGATNKSKTIYELPYDECRTMDFICCCERE
jgi:hypothetical protein